MNAEKLPSHKMGTVKLFYKINILFDNKESLCKLRLKRNCFNQVHNIHWRKKKKKPLHIGYKMVKYLVLSSKLEGRKFGAEGAQLQVPSWLHSDLGRPFSSLEPKERTQEDKSERRRASSCTPGEAPRGE